MRGLCRSQKGEGGINLWISTAQGRVEQAAETAALTFLVALEPGHKSQNNDAEDACPGDGRKQGCASAEVLHCIEEKTLAVAHRVGKPTLAQEAAAVSLP